MSSDEEDDYYGFDYGYDDLKEKKKKRSYQPEPMRNPYPVTQSPRINNELNVKFEKETALSYFHRAVKDGDFETMEDLLQQGEFVRKSEKKLSSNSLWSFFI